MNELNNFVNSYVLNFDFLRLEKLKNCRPFIDFLNKAGIEIWNIGCTQAIDEKSGKICSSCASNIFLLSEEQMFDTGRISKEERDKLTDSRTSVEKHKIVLHEVASTLIQKQNIEFKTEFIEFKRANDSWLSNYSLFESIKQTLGEHDFTKWPNLLKFRNKKALAIARCQLANKIFIEEALQFIIHKQISELKEYATSKNIKLCATLDISADEHSCDAWELQDIFFLDNNLKPTVFNGNTTKIVPHNNRLRELDYNFYKRTLTSNKLDVAFLNDALTIFKINEADAKNKEASRWVDCKAEFAILSLQKILKDKLHIFDAVKDFDERHLELAINNLLHPVFIKKSFTETIRSKQTFKMFSFDDLCNETGISINLAISNGEAAAKIARNFLPDLRKIETNKPKVVKQEQQTTQQKPKSFLKKILDKIFN